MFAGSTENLEIGGAIVKFFFSLVDQKKGDVFAGISVVVLKKSMGGCRTRLGIPTDRTLPRYSPRRAECFGLPRLRGRAGLRPDMHAGAVLVGVAQRLGK